MVWIIISQPDTILGYLPLYIAKELGDFEIISCGNDDESVKAVLEGRADIGVGDPFMFKEIDYGKLKIISAFVTKPFLYIITFNPSIKDLKNKTLVTYPKPSTSYNFSMKLKKKYNLNLIETPFNTEIGPLLTQEADMTLILDPNYTQAIKNGAITLKTLIDEPFAFTGIYSYNKNKKFITLMKRAINIFNNDKVFTLKVAKKYFYLKEDVLKEAISNLRKANIYSTTFTKKEVENALKLRALKYNKYSKQILCMK